MRLVLALLNPSLTRMRAVASRSALTVRRDRFCEANFLGFVRIVLATTYRPECEYEKRMIAHILFQMETIDNTSRAARLAAYDPQLLNWRNNHERDLALLVPIQSLGER